MNTDTECGDMSCFEDDGCPIELAVLQREWRALKTELSHARATGFREGVEAAAKVAESEGAFIMADAIMALLPADAAHSDDIAVDKFAAAMKAKLKQAREEKGRCGWETCSTVDLIRMLHDHLAKGDMRDVANFAMMLWHNENGKAVPVVPDELAALRSENERLLGALTTSRDAIQYAVASILQSAATFLIDPPDTDFQRGYLSAIKTIAEEQLQPIADALPALDVALAQKEG